MRPNCCHLLFMLPIPRHHNCLEVIPHHRLDGEPVPAGVGTDARALESGFQIGVREIAALQYEDGESLVALIGERLGEWLGEWWRLCVHG